MFKKQFELFFGFFGVDLEERFEYLQELISNTSISANFRILGGEQSLVVNVVGINKVSS